MGAFQNVDSEAGTYGVAEDCTAVSSFGVFENASAESPLWLHIKDNGQLLDAVLSLFSF